MSKIISSPRSFITSSILSESSSSHFVSVGSRRRRWVANSRCFLTITSTETARCDRFHSQSLSLPIRTSTFSSSSDCRRIFIVGSGIIGLRTAYEIIQYHKNSKDKVHITIRAPKHPCYDTDMTCSYGAGGLWMPFQINDHRVNTWSIQTLHELYPFGLDPTCPFVEIVPAIRLFQNHNGVNPLHEYQQKDEHHHNKGQSSPPTSTNEPLPDWTNDPLLQFQHLTIEMLLWQNSVYQLRIPTEATLKNAGYLYAWLFHTPIINTIPILQYYIDQISTYSRHNKNNQPNDNITIDMSLNTNHYYQSIDEMIQDGIETFRCDTIINCTGLGSRTICQDNNLIPVRGVLHYYDRKTCIRNDDVQYCHQYHHDNVNDAVITIDEGLWGSHNEPCYMIPRSQYLLIGGTCYENDYEINHIRSNENDRLIENAKRLGINTNQCQPIQSWIGLRPYRHDSIRCEIDPTIHHDVTFIHNYGYGGSGYTLFVGAAKYVVNELLYKNT